MAKTGLSQITTSQTFQTWLDRTNEIVTIIGSDALTASVLGDTTTGNATLLGSFTANTVIAFDTLKADVLSPKDGSASIGATAPINITTSLQVAQTLTSTVGPRINLSSGSIIWRTGFENITDNNFIIDAGTGAVKLRLTPTGNLSVFGSITAGTGGFNGNITGDVDGNVTGNVTGNVSGNAGTVTNGVYTIGDQTIGGTKTFSSTIAGSINGNAATVTNGVYTTGDQTIAGNKTFSGDSSLDTFTASGKGNINGNIAIRNASPTVFLRDTNNRSAMLHVNSNVFYVLRGANDTETWTQVTAPGAPGPAWPMELNLTNNQATFGGNVLAFGDVTAFSASSDIRKKENISKIDNALEKVLSVSGYTYNFIGDDRRITGVIAQEFEKILPEVVYEIDDEKLGRSKAVRYGNIVGLLIEAIKDLKAEIDELKNAS